MYQLLLLLAVLLTAGLAAGQVNLGADPTTQVSKFWIRGDTAVYNNDQQTKVSCPEGYYASNCVCSDETTCDGTEVDLDTRTCSAYHKGDSLHLIKEATMPLVRCKPTESRVVKVIKKRGFSQQTTLTCPVGYAMESCMLHNWYAEYFNAYRVWDMNESEQITCTWKKGQSFEGGGHIVKEVQMTAVCVKYRE